jgi:4,5-dihydroxyphthalate decarboxylase
MEVAMATQLKAMIGDYPITAAMKKGAVSSPHVVLEYADVKVPNTAFKRAVRNLEFDVSELAIVTFLMARAYGKPLVLLPAVIVGRFQHPYLVYNTERGPLRVEDLAGKRVGVRSYSVTTVTWVRGVMADDYGVDPKRVKWVTFEDSHLAEFRDPPNAERAAPGKDAQQMLLAGELDAAILGGAITDPRIKPLIPDPAAAAKEWQRKNGAIQINHMVVVKSSLSTSDARAVREIYRMLAESKGAAGLPREGEIDTQPFGFEANRHNLEVVIDYVHRQGLIPRRYGMDELFDDVTRDLS